MKEKLEELAKLCQETEKSNFTFSFRKGDSMWVLTFMNAGRIIVNQDPEKAVDTAISILKCYRVVNSPPKSQYVLT